MSTCFPLWKEKALSVSLTSEHQAGRGELTHSTSKPFATSIPLASHYFVIDRGLPPGIDRHFKDLAMCLVDLFGSCIWNSSTPRPVPRICKESPSVKDHVVLVLLLLACTESPDQPAIIKSLQNTIFRCHGYLGQDIIAGCT